jgi:hypothetical protein
LLRLAGGWEAWTSPKLKFTSDPHLVLLAFQGHSVH